MTSVFALGQLFWGRVLPVLLLIALGSLFQCRMLMGAITLNIGRGIITYLATAAIRPRPKEF